MWQKLFARLSLLSFVLCLAALGWWIRTAAKVDQLTYQREGIERIQLAGYAGKLMLSRVRNESGKARLNGGQIAWDSASSNALASIEGIPIAASSFSYTSSSGRGGGESLLVMPFWAVVAGLALLPTVWFALKVRKHRKVEKY